MADSERAAEEGGAIAWTEIPTLKEARLGALAVSLEELLAEKRDLEERIAAVRDLISPLLSPIPSTTVRASGLTLRWHPQTPTSRLDRALLVRAGVTPDQLAAGTKPGTKKAYLEVRLAGEPASEEQSAG